MSYPIPGEYLKHYTFSNIRADLGPCRWSLDHYHLTLYPEHETKGIRRQSWSIFCVYTRPKNWLLRLQFFPNIVSLTAYKCQLPHEIRRKCLGKNIIEFYPRSFAHCFKTRKSLPVSYAQVLNSQESSRRYLLAELKFCFTIVLK